MTDAATQLANEHADICHANGLRIHDGAVWDGSVYAFSFGYPEDPQTLRRLIQAYQTGQERGVAIACAPYANFDGPLPDYESPLCGVFGSGIEHTLKLLCEQLGVKDYTAGDGSEDHDNDLRSSLHNIVMEFRARQIYESWSDQPGYKPWAEARSDSAKKYEARDLASDEIYNAKRPASQIAALNSGGSENVG